MVNPSKILVADEASQIRWLLAERLTQEGYDCVMVEDGRQALQALEQQGPFDLLVCNAQLPTLSGLELLTAIHSAYAGMAVILVIVEAEHRLAVEAIRWGNYDFVIKPFNMEELLIRVRKGLERRWLQLENRIYQQQFQRQEKDAPQSWTAVARQGDGSIERNPKEAVTQQQARATTMDALTMILDNRFQLMRGHMWRVSAYTVEMARAMGVSEAELETIRQGAMLHDLGEVIIPDHILNKPSPLTDTERTALQRHVDFGYQVLNRIDLLRDTATMVLHHHERYDGRGYPAGLARDEIVTGAKIFGVADAFDAMTTDRPYRRALGYDDTCAELIRCSGGQFDPAVVEAFFTIPKDRWSGLRHDSERTAKNLQIDC